MNKKLVLSVLSTAVVASMASAAMAKPQPGFYVGGEVDKYYSIDAFLGDHFDDALDDIISELGDTVFVDKDANAAPFVEALDAETSEDLAAIMKPATRATFGDNVYANVGDPTAEPYNPAKDKDLEPGTPAGDLKVESVSALNGKEIQVKFTQQVDKTTAETAGNYTLTKPDGTNAGTSWTAELGSDGKTVVLTLQNAITTKTQVAVVVKNVQLKDDTSKEIPLFATTLIVEDTVAPEVATVVSETNGTTAGSVTINFSEPVAALSVKIDGSAKPYTLSANGKSATVNGLALDASTSHTLEVLNLTDEAGNVTSYINKTFTITKDVNAPVPTLSTESDNKIVLTFDKDMNASTINGTNVKVVDEIANPVTATVTQPVASDKKKYIITITDANLYNNKSVRNLQVTFNNSVLDSLGNKLGEQSKPVSISKDTVAPVITDISFKKNTSGVVTAIVLKLSEGSAAAAGGLSTNDISVINKDGVDVTTNFLAANSNPIVVGDKEVVIPMHASNDAIKSGQYTFSIPAEFVTEDSIAGNKTGAVTKVVNFGEAPASEFEIDQTSIEQTGAEVLANVINVNFAKLARNASVTVKGGAVAGSATDVNNYTLGGLPLPEGTVITLNATKKVATIKLPANKVAKSDASAVLRITNVQTSSGTVIKPFTGTVGVTDNIAPELNSAVLNTNGSVTVGFSETLSTDLVASDLVITVNDTIIPVAERGFAVGSGSESGKYVVTVTGRVYTNGDEETLFIDVDSSGNTALTAGDIEIGKGTTGTYTDGAAINLNLGSVSSLKVGTKATTLTGADEAGNTVKTNKTITVK
ncbi:hypothetical protein ACQKK5_25155 [Brevibacillus panacihumi]|uniref:hypothetical protein n=1 Tax=Brevibacillus panacihumi TaxID=497735 RepID=UPI003D08AA37